MQLRVPPCQPQPAWELRQQEIDLNFAGPVHLCTLFIPLLLEQPEAMIVNVTSGLAFVPYPSGPVYSATKAALHNYTCALRYSLDKTNLRLVELAPPAVKTNLGGSHAFGEECDVFCAAVMSRISAGEQEVGFTFAEVSRTADRLTIHKTMTGRSFLVVSPFHTPGTYLPVMI